MKGHHQAAKKESILNASKHLFSQFGLRKTSIGDIAREARVAKGTIYKYFPSKEAIFREVVQIESEGFVGEMREAVRSSNGVGAKMRAFLITKVTKIREAVNFYRVTREMASELWPHVEGAREHYLAREKDIISEILSEGVERGEISVSSIDLASSAIVMSLKGLELQWILESSLEDLGGTVDTLVDILQYGIVPRRTVR